MWWILGNRIGNELLRYPGVRMALPRDGGAAALTRAGEAIESRVVVKNYRLGRIWNLTTNEARLEFRDRPAAAGFLRRLATEPGMTHTLRSIHAAIGASGATHRLDDRAVLDQLTLYLGTPALEVAVEYDLLPPRIIVISETRPTPEEPRPRADRPARLTFPTYIRRREPTPPEMDPLVVAMEIRRQVETLLRAARDGIPFCEECEKAKLRRRLAALAGASQ